MNSASGDALLAAKRFDDLRKNYPERREFSCYHIANSEQLNPQLQRCLLASGFTLAVS